jgi:hypothetical protein
MEAVVAICAGGESVSEGAARNLESRLSTGRVRLKPRIARSGMCVPSGSESTACARARRQKEQFAVPRLDSGPVLAVLAV